MKAILVIDMPENCTCCPCYNDEFAVCNASDEHSDIWRFDVRVSWCPLKEMPKRKGLFAEMHQYDTDIHYEIGWNACIEEIEK